MTTIFLTGFPGFLGSALVERLLERYPPDVTVTCLVQSKFRPQAELRAVALLADRPGEEGRIHLVDGDITVPDLGLGEEMPALQEATVEIFHLAAVYDLGVERDLAMRVNVDGTHNLLRFARRCPNLQRFHYMSTCYVSGRHPGIFRENDLNVSQTFNNWYEETKYLAELEVQQEMAAGLPATIYRPSVVTGDSHTGATQKYDGPYYFIRWIMKQPEEVAVLPVVGRPEQVRLNVVPRDYVVDAIAYLSALERSVGKVYQICDPSPPTVAEMIDAIGAATGRRIVRVPLPKGVAKSSLEHLPGVESLMGIEPELVEYFVHATSYTCDNTQQDLEGSGITCPPFTDYVANLVAFVRAHPGIPSNAMV
ncbi:MAG: SDR family oxidoreductase [Anaerolineae bacterium]|nr:SDR family oxidoreductase [Anaerolineae bacterium]